MLDIVGRFFSLSLLPCLVVLVLDFGSEIVADVADISDVVLHSQGHLNN
jgi:hypothetical protein